MCDSSYTERKKGLAMYWLYWMYVFYDLQLQGYVDKENFASSSGFGDFSQIW